MQKVGSKANLSWVDLKNILSQLPLEVSLLKDQFKP